MDKLTLKQFRYFEALAREGHFGRAAEACAISQPALSMQIKELEETLGADLFERSARQLRLTGFGEAFAMRVRDVLRSVDELSEFARVAQGNFLSQLRIGIIPTIAPYLLPKIIGNLTYQYPSLDIQIRETQTEKLMQEGLPRDGLEGSSLSTLVQMVGAGIGVTLIPEMAVPVETRSAAVSVARFSDPKPKRTIGMIWRRTNPMFEQLTKVAEIVKRSAMVSD